MWVKWAWATSSYSWNSERGQRYTWATAGYNAHEYEVIEGTSLSEALNEKAVFYRVENEVINCESGTKNTVSKFYNHNIGIIDSETNAIGLNKTGNITICAQQNKAANFFRDFQHNVIISEVKQTNYNKPCESYLHIQEDYNKEIITNITESITFPLSDNYTWNNSWYAWNSPHGKTHTWANSKYYNELAQKVVQFNRNFQDSCSVAESRSDNITASLSEQFGIAEEFDRVMITMFQGTIGDLYAVDSYMTADNFTKFVGRPLDYEEFFEFITGEYEYKDAKIKIDLVAESAQAQPTISGTTMMVDIDDTNDRGTASIYATDTDGTEIMMNKVFYRVPEIQVTLLGATGYGMPNVITNDSWVGSDGIRYFKVKIFNSSGTMINGQISWVAKGY